MHEKTSVADAGTNFRLPTMAGDSSRQENADKSEEQYRLMVETAQQGVWLAGPDQRISYVNQRLADMIGYSPREMLGRERGEFLDPGDSFPLEHDRRRRGVRERRLRRKGGSYLWVLESSSPLVDCHGESIGVLGMIADISERKKTEEVLRAAHRDMERRMLEQLSRLSDTEQVLSQEICDRIRAERALSRREQALESVYKMATTFGISLPELMHRMCRSISSILQLPAVFVGTLEKNRIRIIARAGEVKLAGGDELSGSSRLLGPLVQLRQPRQSCGDLALAFGEAFPFEKEYRSWVGVPAIDHAGAVVGVIVALDREEREFSPDEIRLLEIFAHYAAHELERESMETQLRQSEELKRLGQLCSGVAHEVRNPLNAIQAIVEALFRDIGSSPEYLPYLHHVRTQVNRLSNLMRDLLDLGRPVRQTDLKRLSVADLVLSAVAGWRETSQHAGRPVALAIPEESKAWCVEADGGKLSQALYNLLDNACEHSPPDREVGVRILEPEDRMARIHITDSGKGVAPELQARIFEPFFTTRKDGTGLGLSIVKRMVELHGGVVSVLNNSPPPGLTVEVRLPLSAQE